MDGTCTGEHGIGQGKIGFLEHELGAGVDVMRTIKRGARSRRHPQSGQDLAGGEEHRARAEPGARKLTIRVIYSDSFASWTWVGRGVNEHGRVAQTGRTVIQRPTMEAGQTRRHSPEYSSC